MLGACARGGAARSEASARRKLATERKALVHEFDILIGRVRTACAAAADMRRARAAVHIQGATRCRLAWRRAERLRGARDEMAGLPCPPFSLFPRSLPFISHLSPTMARTCS